MATMMGRAKTPSKTKRLGNVMVQEHLRSSERVMRDVLASKKTARAFLIKAGILAKGGKQLAKPYR